MSCRCNHDSQGETLLLPGMSSRYGGNSCEWTRMERSSSSAGLLRFACIFHTARSRVWLSSLIVFQSAKSSALLYMASNVFSNVAYYGTTGVRIDAVPMSTVVACANQRVVRLESKFAIAVNADNRRDGSSQKMWLCVGSTQSGS